MRSPLLGFAFAISLVPHATTPSPELMFPRDHGAHPESAVEWWYWTGHLSDRAGRFYGFQLTFFRVRDLHLAHFAWTDVARMQFRYEEKTHLGLPGIASAARGRLDLSNEDWTAREGGGGVQLLTASGRAGELELALTPIKPPVLQGEKGFSRKGPGPREFSRYVSITRLAAKGRLKSGSRSEPLSGTAWFDHEWSPGVMPADAAGWDWFALQLDDGSELMLYRMRRADGSATPFSSGTFVPARGPAIPVRWTDVRFTETRFWRSPRSKARYPAGWRIAVGAIGLDLAIEPLVADQELDTPASTGVTYWEGACLVKGVRGGRPVTGRAYVELTGYAGRDVPGLAEAFPVIPRTGRSEGSVASLGMTDRSQPEIADLADLTARAEAPSVSSSAGTSTFRSASSRPSGESTSRLSCCGRRTGTGR